MSITIYHNPQCSKSRQTLSLIKKSGFSPKIIEYLKSPLTKDELKQIINLLGVDVRKIIRNSEAADNNLNLEDPSLTEQQLIDAIIRSPCLLQRPIVLNIKANKAVIGRPPDNVLNIL